MPIERPIMFSPESVSAILAGRKTQTRRVCTFRISGPNPPGLYDMYDGKKWIGAFPNGAERKLSSAAVNCPHGLPSHHLWVREPWRAEELRSGLDGIRFKADNEFRQIENTKEAADLWMAANDNGKYGEKWRNAMFLPRWACRLLLEITAVWVERVQDISANDVEAEGIRRYRRLLGQDGGFPAGWEDVRPGYGGSVWVPDCFKDAYRVLWDSINAKRDGGIYEWKKNPWCWVIEFKRIEAKPRS